RRHTRFSRDWSSDVCSSDLGPALTEPAWAGPAWAGPAWAGPAWAGLRPVRTGQGLTGESARSTAGSPPTPARRGGRPPIGGPSTDRKSVGEGKSAAGGGRRT